jgi:dTDP-glucose 4,6-dehydratase
LRYAVSSLKIQKELGWHPVESFESGIKKTVDWYLKNRKWVDAVLNGEYQSWIKQHYKNGDRK